MICVSAKRGGGVYACLRYNAFEVAAQRAFDALFDHRFDEFKAHLADGTDLERQNLAWVTAHGFEFMRHGDLDYALLKGQKFQDLLVCAIDKGDLEAATFLLDNGADPNTNRYETDDFERVPALYYFFEHPGSPHAREMWDLLIRHGANLDVVVDDGGNTLRTYAERNQVFQD
jgi:hypothetical protein